MWNADMSTRGHTVSILLTGPDWPHFCKEMHFSIGICLGVAVFVWAGGGAVVCTAAGVSTVKTPIRLSIHAIYDQ